MFSKIKSTFSVSSSYTSLLPFVMIQHSVSYVSSAVLKVIYKPLSIFKLKLKHWLSLIIFFQLLNFSHWNLWHDALFECFHSIVVWSPYIPSLTEVVKALFLLHEEGPGSWNRWPVLFQAWKNSENHEKVFGPAFKEWGGQVHCGQYICTDVKITLCNISKMWYL